MLNRRIIKDVYYYKFAGDEEVHMAKAAKRVDDKGRSCRMDFHRDRMDAIRQGLHLMESGIHIMERI